MLTVGLIVNPIAGMGGSVALHGTDGATAEAAVRLGAEPIAEARVRRTLARLAHCTDLRLLAAGGNMGARVVTETGLNAISVTEPPPVTTTEDTMEAARELLGRKVDLVLFVGGDGTATDVVTVVGERIPILGIPSGVKMHSSVFATSPESAAELVLQLVANRDLVRFRRREVLDVVGAGSLGPRALLAACSPEFSACLQNAKASSFVQHSDWDLEALCDDVAQSMTADVTYLVGPGTTTQRVLKALGCHGTLNGVDVVRNAEILCRDATEADLYRFASVGETWLILGVIGGQGFLLGRGNQQVSPRVVREVGENNVIILASEEKLRYLQPQVLRVDTGVGQPNPVLLGYRRVGTGPGRSMVLRVTAA